MLMTSAPPDGKRLLNVTYDLLRHDRQMFALPFVGSVFGIVASLILFAPGYALGWLMNGHERGQLAYYAGAALGGFGATAVAVFFQTALVIGANERAEGGQPTTRSCLRQAWTHRRTILGWALISATVGFVLQLIHDKLGFLGSLLNLFGGLAWSIATYVVVPVLVSEDIGPVSAIRRSTQVLRDTWGTSLRTALRGAVLAFTYWIPFALLVVVGGAMICFGGGPFLVAGISVLAIGVVGLVVLGSIVGAVGTYARALIYRYSVGLPIPGIDTQLLEGAFSKKGSGGPGLGSGGRRDQSDHPYGAGRPDTPRGGVAGGWSASPW
jgi:hypothetical protein